MVLPKPGSKETDYKQSKRKKNNTLSDRFLRFALMADLTHIKRKLLDLSSRMFFVNLILKKKEQRNEKKKHFKHKFNKSTLIAHASCCHHICDSLFFFILIFANISNHTFTKKILSFQLIQVIFATKIIYQASRASFTCISFYIEI